MRDFPGTPVRALVTGATGFVGAAVARALCGAGWQVRALVRPSSDRRNLRQLPLELAVGDLHDPASLERALEACEALFHVAADYRLGVADPQQLYRTNVEGTRSLLEAARRAGIARVVYTSSVAAVGLPADGSPGTEDTKVSLTDMIGHYKRSKFLAEELVREFVRGGAPVIIVNPSTPIGPGDLKPTPTGQMVVDAAAGRTPAYVDTGLNIVHVDDVAAGHLRAFERGRIGERYILGGENMTLHEVLVQICRLAGRAPPRIRMPHAALLPLAYAAETLARLSGRGTRVTVEAVRMSRKHMYFSSAKAARELGYSWRPPAAAFEDALSWFREQQMLGRPRMRRA
jgi:dihydroflavonol-4-reductase